jgi:hypothetical protein
VPPGANRLDPNRRWKPPVTMYKKGILKWCELVETRKLEEEKRKVEEEERQKQELEQQQKAETESKENASQKESGGAADKDNKNVPAAGLGKMDDDGMEDVSDAACDMDVDSDVEENNNSNNKSAPVIPGIAARNPAQVVPQLAASSRLLQGGIQLPSVPRRQSATAITVPSPAAVAVMQQQGMTAGHIAGMAAHRNLKDTLLQISQNRPALPMHGHATHVGVPLPAGTPFSAWAASQRVPLHQQLQPQALTQNQPQTMPQPQQPQLHHTQPMQQQQQHHMLQQHVQQQHQQQAPAHVMLQQPTHHAPHMEQQQPPPPPVRDIHMFVCMYGYWQYIHMNKYTGCKYFNELLRAYTYAFLVML